MPIRRWLLNLIAATTAIAFFALCRPDFSFALRDTIITTNLVTINVLVTDVNNQPIPGLTRHDFAVAEDGAKQIIEYFAHGDLPVSFSLIFDVSDSRPLKTMTQQAAWAFVGGAPSTDEVYIPQLKAGREAVRDFAADKLKLENALSGISSKNNLADLIAEAVKSSEKERKTLLNALVVITDGLSLSGAGGGRDAAYSILRHNTPIYFIILGDNFRSPPAIQSRVRQTRSLLTRIAEVSGGQALLVNREAEISAATEQIIHRMKNQYTMGYYPTNEKRDGSFRYFSVRVTPKDKRKVKVSGPLGYYAIDPKKMRKAKINDK